MTQRRGRPCLEGGSEKPRSEKLRAEFVLGEALLLTVGAFCLQLSFFATVP